MSTRPPRLILASASPRRRDLLARMGIRFEVRSSDVDETWLPGEPASDYVLRIAAAKAGAVRADGDWVLAADTAVVLDGAVFGKPSSPGDAAQMLQRLSGRTHQVVTGVVLVSGVQQSSIVVATDVEMAPMSTGDIEWYVGTGEPLDKAGSYGLQGRGGGFVRRIVGSHSNVVGLPLVETLELLAGAGLGRTMR